MVMNNMKKLPKVKSLYELRSLAQTDNRYLALAIAGAQNLGYGGQSIDLNKAMAWLNLNANESGSEKGVVDEVNFCRDLV